MTTDNDDTRLIGVRHGHQTRIIKFQTNESYQQLNEKIINCLQINTSKPVVYLDWKCTKELTAESLKDYNLKSGSMLFVALSSNKSNGELNKSMTAEDFLDEFLDNVNIDDIYLNGAGKSSECTHSSRSRCLKCLKNDPFDEEYLRLRDPPIKHLSFHAYLRKLKVNVSGKYLTMQEISCKVAKGCTNHQPWPNGICTRCQPSGMMLQRQTYRHVDNVMFENSKIADRFLDFWRQSGSQRIGYLFGSYEYYRNVPLGIRAVVKTIYEPPQVSGLDSIELIDDPNDLLIDKIAAQLGLSRIGWIFTDLVALPQNANCNGGTVKCVRASDDEDMHFLSAQECIMAASFQHKYPNKCKFSKTGIYGSKFVTVIVTGDKSNHIHFEGYQVSNQCMSLVRENCLVPTIDVPELAFLRESSPKQYIPDVFYKHKDDFDNEVTTLARPLPVEYLLIDVPAAFAKVSTISFPSEDGLFPIENRSIIQANQDLASFLAYYNSFESDSSICDMFSNLHFLTFLASNEWMPLEGESLDALLNMISNKDEVGLKDFCEHNESWNTLLQLAKLSGESGDGAWACSMCTFHNSNRADACAICGNSRDVTME